MFCPARFGFFVRFFCRIESALCFTHPHRREGRSGSVLMLIPSAGYISRFCFRADLKAPTTPARDRGEGWKCVQAEA